LTVRREFKKWMLMVLVVCHVQIALTRSAHAEPPVVAPLTTPSIPTSGGEGLFDLLSYVLSNPFSEGTVILGLMVGLAKTSGWTLDALIKIPSARANRRTLTAAAKQIAKDYEVHRAEYKMYPLRIAELESANKKNRDALMHLNADRSHPAENIMAVEKMRREIEKNDRMIQAMREKAPAIQIAESIVSLSEAEKAVDTQVEKLKSTNPLLVSLWKATKRPDYIGEWLQSEEGRNFEATDEGKAWRAEYDKSIAAMGAKVSNVTTLYNTLVKEYNDSVPASERVARLDYHESEHGRMGDHFLLTPEVPSEVPRELHRDSVLGSAEEVCAINLARLKKASTDATNARSFYRSYRQQIWSFGSLGAVGTALWRYTSSFQDRYQKSFQEARAKSRLDAKISENAKTSFGGQMDEEKKGLNRLKPFMDVSQQVVAKHQHTIVRLLHDRLNGLMEKASGKSKLLSDRVLEAQSNPEAEAARIAHDVEEGFKRFYSRQTGTTLEQALTQLYSEDEATRGTLMRNLTLIYRESIANLYGNIADEKLLDEVETSLIPAMVEETSKKLLDGVGERKKAAIEKAKRANTTLNSAPGTPSTSSQTSLQSMPQTDNSLAVSDPVSRTFDDLRRTLDVPSVDKN
jgi:hypothetical protein